MSIRTSTSSRPLLRLALAVSCIVAMAVSCTDGRTVRPVGPPSDHRPVIFVHGIGADDLNLWAVAVESFKARGYTAGDITDFHYVSLNGVAPAAEQLAVEVDHLIATTGKPKVDIVSHSLGALVTKLCVVEGGCQGKVDHWEILAGANNGTDLRFDEPSPTADDVRPEGPLVQRLQAAAPAAIAGQGIEVQVQWTPGDTSILPPERSREPFADNVRLNPVVTHQTILWDLGVITTTFRFLNP